MAKVRLPAIDNTDRMDCGACYADSEVSIKQVLVEYLYLDLQTCGRCISTDKVLDEVMVTLTPALEMARYAVSYRKTEMASAEIAQQYAFLSSPTIRVNGHDICRLVKENSCGCCSDISGTDVDCRVFEYEGEIYEVPPKAMLAEAILQAVFGRPDSSCSCGGYQLPDNLKDFFDGKESKPKCSCGGTC